MWLGAMYEYAGMGKPAVSIEILERRINEIKERRKRSLDIKIASFKLFFIFMLHSSAVFGKDFFILPSSNEIIKEEI